MHMAEIAAKDSYSALTNKQQSVVDELVDDPTAQNTVIADRAGVSRSTVYNVKEHYGHIVESRLNKHGRYEGGETTEGDPFDGQLEFTRASQFITDRPEQDTSDTSDTDTSTKAEDQGITVDLTLNERDIEAMLTTQRVPRNVTNQLLTEVLGQFFGSD